MSWWGCACILLIFRDLVIPVNVVIAELARLERTKPFHSWFLVPNVAQTVCPFCLEHDSTALRATDSNVACQWHVPCVVLVKVDYLAEMTGMHEFAEFAAADVGTVDSGLNSMVLASDNEMVSSRSEPLEKCSGAHRLRAVMQQCEQNRVPSSWLLSYGHLNFLAPGLVVCMCGD